MGVKSGGSDPATAHTRQAIKQPYYYYTGFYTHVGELVEVDADLVHGQPPGGEDHHVDVALGEEHL